MAAVTICSDFGALKYKFWHCFHSPIKWWDQMPWSSFSECWVLSQLFHSPLSLSSRGSSVSLFANKVLSSQSYGFSSSHVWIWELGHKEGCVLKNWCFQAVVLEKTLMSPWTARSSNQSILKEISPEYSLEGLMQKLKLQYFDHLMRRVDSLEKTLMLEKIEGRRKSAWMRWLDGTINSINMRFSKLYEIMTDWET